MTDFLHKIEHENAPTIPDSPVDGTTAFLPGTLFGYPIQHADHATETLTFKTQRKIEIFDVQVLKDGTDAGGTVQVKDASAAAITDAIAAAVDKTSTRAGTIDPAKRVVPAGGTFTVVYTRGTGSSKSEVILYVALRA